VAATTNTGWQRRSLFIDEVPGVGLEDVDVLLFGESSLSMSFSYTYNAYNNDNNNIDAGVVGNDDVDSIGGTSTTTPEVFDEVTGEIVVFHHEGHPSTTITTITPSSTSNTQTILPPTTTIDETFANIPTYPATSTTTRSLLPLISIAGGLVAIGAIIGGVYRTKKQKKTSNNNGGGDEKSIQSINSKSTDESELSSSLADEENDNSRIASTTTSSLSSMATMSTLVSSSSRVDRRASI
jgi:hypothetical protein